MLTVSFAGNIGRTLSRIDHVHKDRIFSSYPAKAHRGHRRPVVWPAYQVEPHLERDTLNENVERK